MICVIVAGHRFADTPTFSLSNGERHITIAVPYNTERNVINELQDATELQVTDPLGSQIIGTHRLIGWRSIETFFGKNNQIQLLITWAIPNPDETERLKQQIVDLETTNEDLTQIILELASIIGAEEPEEEEET